MSMIFYRVERREVGSDKWETIAANFPTCLGAQKYLDFLPGRYGSKRFDYRITNNGEDPVMAAIKEGRRPTQDETWNGGGIAAIESDRK